MFWKGISVNLIIQVVDNCLLQSKSDRLYGRTYYESFCFQGC